jgi:hypothetical protein
MAERSNWLDIKLSKADEEFVCKSGETFRRTQVQTIDTVLDWARSIKLIRDANYGDGIQGGFTAALVQYGFTHEDDDTKPIDPALRSQLQDMLDHEESVIAFWNEADPRKRREWRSPRTIHRNWKASFKPKVPKQPPRASVMGEQRERIAELEQELATARSTPAEAPSPMDDIAAGYARHELERRIAELEAGLANRDSVIDQLKTPAKPSQLNLQNAIFRCYDLTHYGESWPPKTKATTKDNLKQALAEVWEALGMGDITEYHDPEDGE